TQPSGQGEKFPAKGFEYLYLRKPVLCLSAPGVTTELLARSGLGTVVDPADLAGIKAALRTFYDRRHQPARGDAAFIARFDRRRLTEELAGIFDTLAGVRHPPLPRHSMSATNGKALAPAVVLGLGQNGLATVRALARMGVPVIGIDSDLEQPGAHTRYARKVHCPGFATEGPELADHLMR